MDNRLRRTINNLAQDIIDIFEIQVPIEDIELVVRALGGSIRESAEFGVLGGGSIRKIGNSFEICISPFQTPERKRFTVAHELGHLFLHMGYRISEDIWNEQDSYAYHRNGDSEMEYQANEFAAALLMPEQEYIKVMENFTEDNLVDTSKIAQYFGVSVVAASNRGKFLGYLQW